MPRKKKQTTAATTEVLNPRILIIGTGSLGCYLAGRVGQLGVPDTVSLALLHHKAELLANTRYANTFLLNKSADKSQPLLAEPQHNALLELIRAADLVFICTALGGDSGAIASELALWVKQAEKPGIGFCITPFQFEGEPRLRKSRAALQQLETRCNGLLVLANDSLRQALGKHALLEDALNASNVFLHQLLTRLLTVLTEPGLINIDLNDFLAIIGEQGRMVAGFTELLPQQALEPQLAALLNQPLLQQAALNSAKGALLHLLINEDFTTTQLHDITSLLCQQLPLLPVMITGVSVQQNQPNPVLTLFLTGLVNENGLT